MESESPPSRTTILGSFLRGRPRNSSQSFTSPDHPRELSPPSRRSNNNNNNNNLNTPNALQASTSQPQQQSAGLAITQMLRRRRSAGNVNQNQAPTATAAGAAVAGASAAAVQHQSTPPPPPQSQTQPHSTTQAALMLAGYTTLLSEGRGGASAGVAPGSAPGAAAGATVPSNASSPQPNNTTTTNSLTHRIRLVPHLDSRRSLRFDPIGRDLREGDPALRIGRFTDRSGLGLAAINSLNSNKLAFRSKVVSRAHAEIWVEGGGKFFIRDTKSSSGTFLNHVRLSAANLESRPFQIKDGDVLQLGVDYQGGTEDIYKSVKIRVEIGREWQHGANAFNTNAFKNLKALALPLHNGGPLPGVLSSGKIKSLGIPDCCICLFSVTIRQALFIAPCSHTFHFKCIRPILEAHHPSFSCPLCRTYANLEEDVEVDEASWEIDVSEEDEANNKIGEGENAVGAAGGPAHDGGEDDRMDVDSDRPAVVFEEPEMESAEAGGGGGGESDSSSC